MRSPRACVAGLGIGCLTVSVAELRAAAAAAALALVRSISRRQLWMLVRRGRPRPSGPGRRLEALS